MKYIYSIIETPAGVLENITTKVDEITLVNFPAVIGNPSYDAFLVKAELTDKQVKALKPDTWYDFPAEGAK